MVSHLFAANCRNLREIDLRESEVKDLSGHWLSHFPDNCTSLVSLNISCLGSELSFSALERLVARSPSLRRLRLNHAGPLERLANLLHQDPKWLNWVLVHIQLRFSLPKLLRLKALTPLTMSTPKSSLPPSLTFLRLSTFCSVFFPLIILFVVI